MRTAMLCSSFKGKCKENNSRLPELDLALGDYTKNSEIKKWWWSWHHQGVFLQISTSFSQHHSIALVTALYMKLNISLDPQLTWSSLSYMPKLAVLLLATFMVQKTDSKVMCEPTAGTFTAFKPDIDLGESVTIDISGVHLSFHCWFCCLNLFWPERPQ